MEKPYLIINASVIPTKTPLEPVAIEISRNKISLDLTLNDKIPGIEIISTVKTTGPTGVEMEALTAASISALTVYDMVKSLDKSIIIKDLRLVFKDGGKSGLYESS